MTDLSDPAAGFVAKLAATGHPSWSVAFGEDTEAVAEAVAYDAAGDVIVVGSFSGTIAIGDTELTSADAQDVVVARLEGATGETVWARRFGGAGYEAARDIAVDGAGYVYVVGQFDESLDFGDGAPLVSAGRTDAFVAKLSPAGEAVWSRSYGGPNHDRASSVAVDADGAPIVAGVFEDGADFGEGPVMSAGGHDVFLAALDGSGSLRYSRTFGSSGRDDAHDVAVSPEGRVAVTGSAASLIDFGGGSICNEGDETDPDAYVLVLSSAGDHLWSRCMGWNYSDYGTAVQWEPAESLLLAATFDEHVDPGGGGLYCGGLVNSFAARYSPAGEFMAASCYGGPHYQVVTSMALDPWGHLLLAGYFMGDVDFGTGLLESCAWDFPDENFGFDIFVVKTDL